MKGRRSLSVLVAALLPLTIAFLPGCPKEEETEEPPPPPPPPPPPTPTVELAPEVDAGSDADASDDAGDAADAKPRYTGPAVSNLGRCCAAIKQNMNSAPPEQKGMYLLALSACNSGQIPAQFRNLPACK